MGESNWPKIRAMTRQQWLKVAETCEQMTVNSSLCLSGLSLRARSQVYKHFKLWENNRDHYDAAYVAWRASTITLFLLGSWSP
jgi:hypothetical protein